MYLNFKDICFIMLKSFIWTLIICFIIAVGMFNYNLGTIFCNYINIPKDLNFSIISSSMVVDITIDLFVIEFAILFLIIKYSKIKKLFNYLCNFLSFEI